MKTIVWFHVGRGGRFYNPNHIEYKGVYDKGLTHFALTSYTGKDVYYGGDVDDSLKSPSDMSEDEALGLPLYDASGSYLGAGYGDEVGTLSWDGEYDSDIFMYLDEIEYDDKYYNAIKDSKNYIESEVAEYIKAIEG